MRDDICELIHDPDERAAFFILLSKFNVLIKVVQQVQHKVNPNKLRELGYDLMIYMKTKFPFVMIFPLVHVLCAHYWELFVMTNGAPIIS